MILLWGIAGDTPLRLVYEALVRTSDDVVFLDQQSTADAAIELETLQSAYIRPYPASMLSQSNERRDDMLLNWCELTSALVVNRPSAMTSNNSKPYQAALIRSSGLDTPETLITTDPQAALAFWELHESVICKSISSVRSIVARLTQNHRDRLPNVRYCPTQFQEYIPGIDYRVHIVGDECFASEIVSDSDDYRYAAQFGKTVDIRSCRITEALRERCHALATGMGLHVAGIDLRRTPEDKWYCFEVNPSPAFSFYESATGQLISEAVARLLSGRT